MPVNQQIFFAKQSYKMKGKQLCAERLVNMHAETIPEEDGKGKGRYVLYGSQGLNIWLNLGVYFPVYELKVVGNNLYAIVGTDVYIVRANKTFAFLGSLTSPPDRVKVSANGTQLSIVDKLGNGYVATDSAFAAITDIDYEPSSDTTFIDSYTVYPVLDSDVYKISEQNDSSSIEVEFSSAESEPDKIVGSEKYNGQLWLFGTVSTEVHQNTGNVDFPFERVQGAVLDKGCVARYSIAKDDENLIWLAPDNIFYRAVGYGYEMLSTPPITELLNSLSRTDDCFAFTYNDGNHLFYSAAFPTDGITIEIDLTERLWHDKQSFDKNNRLTRWRGNCCEIFNNQQLVGDFENGIIYELDPETYTEGGKPLLSIIDSKIFSSDTGRFVLNRLELDFDSGVGATTGQGSDPIVSLAISNDGCKTFGPEMFRKIGKIGEYENRAEWRNLGIVGRKGMGFRVKISDPVKRALLGAYIDYDQLED